MAHIKKLDSGRWQARYRNPEDRREIARNFTTRAAAQAWLDGVTASLVRADYATRAAVASPWRSSPSGGSPQRRRSSH